MKILGRYFWVPKYLKKRFWQNVGFYKSKLQARSSYLLAIEDQEIKLGFVSPYHHSIAESMSHGAWEVASVHAWAQLCREHLNSGQVIYDIGGYNGIYGLLAAKIDASAKVYIYEPDPLNARQCRLNAIANDLAAQVTVREIALSDVEGTVSFHADGSSGASIGRGGKNMVRSEKLDTQQPKPSLIKIDIEGAEADLILVSPEMLKAKPRIILEVHSVVSEEKRCAMWDMLKRNGYQIEQLHSDAAAKEEPRYILR